jgi:uncharacterized protein YjbI with pentapeptide repeats
MDGDKGTRPGRLTAAWRRKPGKAGARLAPMWLALGGTLTTAVVIAVLVTFLGLRALHFRQFQPEPQLSAATLYDLLKIAFAVAAGVGGVVALVTAYRRQRVAEFTHQLTARSGELAARAEEREAARLLNERFTTVAGQLGSDNPAVRLAGVYAIAGLADDWPKQRQTCVDVLCASLRMPYAPEPADDAPEPDRQAFYAGREVRHTAIRVITAHLQPDNSRPANAQDWRSLDLDFTGAILDGGDFTGAQFTGGTVDFTGAKFTSGTAYFNDAVFAGGTVYFRITEFTGGNVNFRRTQFTGSTVYFNGAKFSGGTVDFKDAAFSGGTVYFNGAKFSGGTVDFSTAAFSRGAVYFDDAEFSGSPDDRTTSTRTWGKVSFRQATFTGAIVDFSTAKFTGGNLDYRTRKWFTPPFLPDWDLPT